MSKKYEIEVAQIQHKIEALQKSFRIVTSPVELDSLEKEIQLLVNESKTWGLTMSEFIS